MECNLAIQDVTATYKAFLKANTTILSMCNVIMFLEYDLYILPFNKAIMKCWTLHYRTFPYWQLKILFKTQPLAIII